jgi:hypothetical protein
MDMSRIAEKAYLLWVKWTNEPRYRYLKHESKRAPRLKALADFGAGEHFQLGRPPQNPSFKHSGNAGDIIYALPTVRALAGSAGASLHLALNVPMHSPFLDHPLGGVMLSNWMYELLKPLLQSQTYLLDIRQHAGEVVDYDLDLFRRSPIPQDRIGICRWYFYATGVAPDLSEPWLQANPDARSAIATTA